MKWAVLGPVTATVDGRVLDLGRPQQRGVLAYLLVNANLVISVDQLVHAIWGPAAPASARTQVYGYVSRLRRTVGPPAGRVLTGGSAGYRLTVDGPAQLDLTGFTEHLGRARAAVADGRAAEAAELYRSGLALWSGPALGNAVGAFVPSTALRLEEQRLMATEELTDVELGLGRHATLVPQLHAVIEANPLRERLVGQLMLALYRGGRQAEALTVFSRYRHLLGEEHGLDPGPHLAELHESVIRADPLLLGPGPGNGHGHPGVAPVRVRDDTVAAAFEPGRRPAGAVPPARVALVGRDTDVAALTGLLSTHRVVTISGPGGAGKSTVALALAGRCLDEGGCEVAFVGLAPVRHDTDIVRAVAEATGVQGPGASDLMTLVASLAPRHLLLVLDNCEHLLDGTARLVDALLDAAPAAGPHRARPLRVLATSREPLGVDGEAVHVLGPLGPDAATLFVQRAASSAGLTLAPGDPDVAELCERLDGLPLAIELAAAQLRHLTVGELLARLDDRLGILVGGRPRVGTRHATLAGTIEWSYDLLSAGSRQMFERLGVFPAEFDLATAQAVSPGHDAVATTNLMRDLVAKNLVVHEPGTGRYRLLETIRLFAAHRLGLSGRRTATAEHLRRHIVNRMTARTRPRAWLSATLAARNRDDIENVRAAFAASLARAAFTDAIDIMVGLSTLWRNAVSYAEGMRWAAGLRGRDLTPRDRLWLHIVEADLGLGSGDPRLMNDAATAAVRLAATVDDPAAAVIATIYRCLASLVTRPDVAVAGLDAARDRAGELAEPELNRLARAYRVVALLAAGRRTGLDVEIRDLIAPAGNGYDRYICVWAAYVDALVNRDGPALREWMNLEVDHVRGSGLRENWVMLYLDALAQIAEGADYLPRLRLARDLAEAEGRRADVDCVLALSYAAACRDDAERAAELIGASGGGLFHDTANFVHHMLIRDRVVRPMLDPTAFEAALRRGRARSVAAILAEQAHW